MSKTLTKHEVNLKKFRRINDKSLRQCKLQLKSLGIPVEKSPPFRHDPPINQIGGRKDDGIYGEK